MVSIRCAMVKGKLSYFSVRLEKNRIIETHLESELNRTVLTFIWQTRLKSGSSWQKDSKLLSGISWLFKHIV